MPANEGVLDAWVAQWFADNPAMATPRDEWSPEMLELARADFAMFPGPEVATVSDSVIAGVPVRLYQHDPQPRAVFVYFHGGGFCTGSIGLMDNVARQLARAADVAVVSVGYRLAPEHPYPAGLDDCAAVTLAILEDTSGFGAPELPVIVGGESAGGSLAAGVSMRVQNSRQRLAAQVLIYPGVAGGDTGYPSRAEFDGILLTAAGMRWFWDSYRGGQDLQGDPHAVPLSAESLAGLPPAIVVLGGCDVLRDEGRRFAERLAADGVDVEEVCYPGQPHGFVNFGFPAAAEAFQRIGAWLTTHLTTQQTD